MGTNLLAQVSIAVDVSPENVWEAITNPESIRKYLMSTNVETDWKEGSPIMYHGEYNG